MRHLRLDFLLAGHYELDHVCFQHPLARNGLVLECDRGQTQGVRGHGTFPWSKGVQSLALFFVTVRLRRDPASLAEAVLSGEAGSAAACLDMVLSKSPSWTADMFSSDSDGTPILRRLIRRNNPERKRPGPVSLYLNATFFDPAELEICVHGRQVHGNEFLSAIAQSLKEQIGDGGAVELISSLSPRQASDAEKNVVASYVPRPCDLPGWLIFLRKILGQEILQMLQRSSIFFKPALEQDVERILRNPSFSRVAGRVSHVVSELDRKLTSTSRLGCLTGTIPARREPINIYLSLTMAPSLAIFTLLQRLGRMPLKIHYSFASTSEIVAGIVEERFDQMPDCCVLGLAPAAVLFAKAKRRDFSPLMLMPNASNRLCCFGNGGRDKSLAGEFLLPTNHPTSASFYFDELVRIRAVNKSSTKVSFLEPDEIEAAFSDGDPNRRSILWFPHYQINRIIHGTTFAPPPRGFDESLPTILFAHNRLLEDTKTAEALDVAIRDAWLQLLESRKALEDVLTIILGDEEYLRLLSRVTGLYRFRDLPIQDRVFDEAPNDRSGKQNERHRGAGTAAC